MKKHYWQKNEDEWIMGNHGSCKCTVLTRMFNSQFGTDVTTSAMRQHCIQYLGLNFGKKGIEYSEEEDAWILEHYLEKPLRNLYEEWKELFPEHRITFYGFKGHCREKLKLQLPDKEMWHNANVPVCDIGTEHKRSGYVLVKVKHKRSHRGEHEDRRNWKFKHRVMWEKYNGRELRDDEQVVFLNGDREDFSKENLYAVPVKWMPMLNANGWLKGNRELAMAGIKFCELHYLLEGKKKEGDSNDICE